MVWFIRGLPACNHLVRGSAINSPIKMVSSRRSFLASAFVTALAVPTAQQADSSAVEFPPIIDADDIAYFFEKDDLEGLHWALTSIFSNSERANPSSSTKLPEQLVSRGGGLKYSSEYKLFHDLEQAEYLSRNLEDPTQAKFFGETVAPVYREMLGQIPPLEELERTSGLYAFTKEDYYEKGIGSVYNRALRLTDFDALKDQNGKLIPLLNPELDVEKIEKTMLCEGVVVVDNLLTPDALERIRQVMLESTAFFQVRNGLHLFRNLPFYRIAHLMYYRPKCLKNSEDTLEPILTMVYTIGFYYNLLSNCTGSCQILWKDTFFAIYGPTNTIRR